MDHKAAVKSKNKKKLSELLPKAVAAVVVNFQKPLYSPKKEKKLSGDNVNTRFSSHTGGRRYGEYISSSSSMIVPAEAHRRLKNNDEVQLEQDPKSPKISCMGQIKHHKSHNKMITVTKQKNLLSLPPPPEQPKKRLPTRIKKAMSFSEKRPSTFKSIFGGGRKSDASGDDHFKQPQKHLPDRAPSLSQMRRFASGRDALASFDWTAQLAALDPDYNNNNNNNNDDDKFYYDIDDEERCNSDDDDVSIPFSGPLHIIDGIKLEPKKEINLWKRRTMAQPKPLQLNT